MNTLLSRLLALVGVLVATPAITSYAATGDKLLNATNIGLGAPNDLDPYFVDFDRAYGIAALSNGNVVVCWRERDNTSAPVPTPDSPDGANGKGYACFFRVYGPTGTAITAATRPYLDINADGTGDQNTPLVAALSGGGFVITWNSAGGPGDTYDPGFGGGDAWGRVYDNSGASVSGTFHVNENDPNGVPDTQEPASVVGLSGGGFAILWVDGNDNGPGLGANNNTDDYFLRVYAANGTPAAASVRLGGIGQDAFFKDFEQFGGAAKGMTPLPNGSVVVGWAVRDQSNNGTGVSPDGTAPNGGGGCYFQVFDAAGAAVTTATSPYLDINANASGSQLAPAVAALSGGGFAIVWNSNHNTDDGGNSDVGVGGNGTSGGDTYTRVYTNAGVSVSGTSRVNDLRTDDSETPAGIVSLSDGGFAIVWKEDDDNTAPPLDNTDDYYARAYNANGTPRNPSVLIGGAAADPLFNDISSDSGLIALSDGGFAVGLRVRDSANNGTGTSFDGVAPDGGYAATVQLFNANGTTRTAPFFPYGDINPDFSGNQNTPILCSIAGGGFAVTWHSNQNSNDTDNDLPFIAGSTSNGGDTYTRIFNNAGTALHGTVQAHGEGAAEPTGTIDQQDPFGVIGLTGGNYAIVIRDDNDATNNKDDLFLSIFEGVPSGPPPVPEIAVTEAGVGNVADGGSFSFGTTTIGTPVTKTFTVTNSGTATLNLSALALPSGFTIAQNFASSTVASGGGTTTFQVTMSASAAGSPSGTLSFANNDSDENPYNFTISGTVNPPPAPTVTGVTSSTANGTYKIGDVLSIQVNFSVAVTVTGTPQLTLETGAVDRTVNFTGGSGTSSLAFNYTVQSGDATADLDYLGTSSLVLNGGTIRDAFSTNAVLTLSSPGAAGSLAANRNLVIDGERPTAGIVVADTTLTAGETSLVTITFSEAVNGFTNADLTVENGLLSPVSSSDGGITWTATFTPNNVVDATNVITLANTGVADLAGNAGSGTTASNNYAIDIRTVSITPLDSTKAEGTGSGPTNFTFTVARTGDTSGTVTVDAVVTGSGLAPTNGSDFGTLPTSITIPNGDTSAVLTIPVAHDAIVEPNEDFTVTLSNPTNGYVLNGATATGTITNDDSSTLTLTGGGSANEGNAGANTRTYTATLSNAVQGGFSVAYTTDDGTATTGDGDYVDNDGSLAFVGGANESKTIDVTVNGDPKVEADEAFDVSLGLVTGASGTVTLVDSSTASTLTNDDSATISIGDVSQLESAGSMSFSVTLSAPADVAVTIDFATDDGTAKQPGDYGSNSGTATFPANSNTTQAVMVTIVNDGDFEADEDFFVNLSDLSASGRSVSVSDAQGVGTIQNDDTLTVTINATDDSAEENTPETGTWRVTRNGTLGDLLVNLQVDAASTGVAADWTQTGASFVSMEPGGIGTVTIPDGSTSVDIVLTPIDDPAAEADEEVTLNVTASGGYTVGLSLAKTITIDRNDFVVTTTNDLGEGSLRQAIENANFFAGMESVTFEGPVFADAIPDTIVLATALPDIATDLEIVGTGSDLLSISGDDLVRTFLVNAGTTVTMTDLTLTHGFDVSSGGALLNDGDLRLERCVVRDSSAATQGGALQNHGTLTLVDCTLAGNTANDGAGIISYGVLFVRGSTFSGNVGAGEGGAIFSSTGGPLEGSFEIVNSTFSGNTAGPRGGAISIISPLAHTITNSTLTGNAVDIVGASGGGIETNGSPLTLHNTLVAGNLSTFGGEAPSDISGAVVGTSSHNLVGTGGSGGLLDGTNGNLVDIADPLVGPLADNGGPTFTRALLVGSPALDAGDPLFDGSTFTPALTNDQRGAGFTRVTKGIATSATAILDIGAYELIAAPVFTDDDLEITTGSAPLDLTTASGVTPSGGTFSGTGVNSGTGFFDPTGLGLGGHTVTYTVTDPGGSTNSTDLTVTVTEVRSLTVTAIGDVVSKIDGQTSLREALEYAATLTGHQTVDFSDNTDNGAVHFHDATPDTIVLDGSELVIEGDVTVEGPGNELLTLDGDGLSGIFHVPGTDPSDEIVIRSLTLTNGSASYGGGILVDDGIVTVENSVIEGNVATTSGGAIATFAGELRVIDSRIEDNEASGDSGGGLFIDGGTATVTRTILKDNLAALNGGGAYFSSVTGVIRDSHFEGNTSDADGGGLYVLTGGTLSVINTTLSDNTSTNGSGGGAFADGDLILTQVTITANTSILEGGGIAVGAGTATLANTLVAMNNGPVTGPDVFGTFTDSGSNLIGIEEGSTGFTVSTLLGTTAAPLDALLAPLANNGGPTLTHALLLGSPAIDAGDNALALDDQNVALTSDQRGFARIVKGLQASALATVDIGAYELFAAPQFTDSTLRVSVDGTPVDLAGATGATPPGGVFSGPGVSGGSFDPRTLVPGAYTLTYTAQDPYGVFNSATFTVNVLAIPAQITVQKPKRFAPTEIGERSRTQRIRITNFGGTPATGLRLIVRGPGRADFKVIRPRLRTLAAGASTTFRATFQPKREGERKVTVTVSSSAPAVKVTLQGRGVSNSDEIRDPDRLKPKPK